MKFMDGEVEVAVWSSRFLPQVGRKALVLAWCVLLFSALLAFQVNADEDVGDGQGISVLRSDDQGVLLELVVPDYSIQKQTVEGSIYQTFHIPGWEQTSEAGWPQLPVRNLVLGVPLGADLRVQVVKAEMELLPGSYNVLPVPDHVLEAGALPHELADLGLVPRQEFVKDEKLYGTDSFYPDPLAEIVGDGRLRRQRVANLQVRPFQFNPVRGQVQVCTRLVIEISFGGAYQADARSELDKYELAGYEELFRKHLLNYDKARKWRGKPLPTLSSPSWQPPSPGYKISVNAEGMYKMDYAYLQAAGLPVDSLDPRTFQLFLEGSEVAINVYGEADASFDAGDSVVFYGDKETTRYTDERIYWLTYGAATGLRMAQRDGTPTGGRQVPDAFKNTAHVEENLQYMSVMPGEEELDRWYWNYVLAYEEQPGHQDYEMTLSTIVPDTYPATLRIPLLGGFDAAADPDHHVELYVNSQLVADTTWDGFVWHQVEVEFPQSYLGEGVNTLTARCPNDTGEGRDVVYVDWFEIDYHDRFVAEADRLLFDYDAPGVWEFQIDGFSTDAIDVYDVTDGAAVQRITGGVMEPGYRLRFEDTVADGTSYMALTTFAYSSPLTIELDTPSDWQSASNGADYLVITHANFYAQAQALADYRQSQGLRVAVIDVEDVHDEFSYGILNPHAIKDFLAHAYDQWQPPAPTYVILFGDGTYDFKDYWGLGPRNYVSPFMAYVDPWLGDIAADNQYVCVDGPDDQLPDMHLGRIPVNTVSEAQAVVDKITGYEQVPSSIGWNQKLTFAADNIPDSAGDFIAASEALIDNHVSVPYASDRVYLNDFCGPPTTPTTFCPAATAALLAKFNEGRLFVNYIGHGATRQWASERLLYTTNVDAMSNADKYPISLAMTCSEGNYVQHRADCLSETLLRATGKGSVATWGMTGFGTVFGHDLLNSAFFDAIFFEGVRELGAATLEGKLNLWQYGGHDYLLDATLVFGDPALHINALSADVQIEKTVEPSGEVALGDVITYTLIFTNAGPDPAYGVQIIDLVPPGLVNPTVIFSSSEVLTQYEGVTFTWTITDLLPHAGGQIQIRAVVSPTVGPELIVNEVEIVSPTDVDPANNVASATVDVYLPDLVVTKAGPAETIYNQTITYTLAWGNQGDIAAPRVRLVDTLPDSVEYVADSSGFPLTQPTPGILVWEVTPDPVPVGLQDTFVLTAWVTMHPVMTSPLVNQIEGVSDLPDGNPTDSQSLWSTNLLLPDLAVRKAGPDQAFVNSVITYTLVYSNEGDLAALGVVITDQLPAGVTYVSDDSGLFHSEPVPGTHVWQVGQLPVGDGDSFSLVARVGQLDDTGPLATNTALIGAVTPDARSDNGLSSWSTQVRKYEFILPLVFKDFP